MQVEVKDTIQVVDPDTGVIQTTKPYQRDEELFQTAEWMQRTRKVLDALKPVVDKLVEKRIDDRGGEPIEVGDKRLIFKSYQTYRIPPEAVLAQFEDKDQAIIILTEAMRADAVSQSGIKRLVDEGTLEKEDAAAIMKAKEPAGARAHAQVERHKFDEKGDAA